MQSGNGRFRNAHCLGVAAVLIGAPLLGVLFSGKPLAPFLEFPLRTKFVVHASFSWPVFIFFALFIAATCFPFLWRFFTWEGTAKSAGRLAKPLVWWGWLGFLLVFVFWFLAWNRFTFFEPLQRFTFFPLWFGYILAVNALTCRRQDSCLLLSQPLFLWSLFPASALFWWYFEYLNRMVQNWYYMPGTRISALEYTLHATICFATVLPAVISTIELLGTFPRLTGPFSDWREIRLPVNRCAGVVILSLSAIALAVLVVLPDYLFPMVWIGPLFVIVGIQMIRREKPFIFGCLAKGNWQPIVLPALVALICGFFWELWNWKSLAHWQYSVPFVDRFHLFAMPLLGYGGYLPFGLECFVVASLLYNRDPEEREGVNFYPTCTLSGKPEPKTDKMER